MEIRRYTTYHEAEVLRLYKSVGWAVYADDPAMLKAAFAGSLLVLGAFAQDELIGLVRAVGDGVSILYNTGRPGGPGAPAERRGRKAAAGGACTVPVGLSDRADDGRYP